MCATYFISSKRQFLFLKLLMKNREQRKKTWKYAGTNFDINKINFNNLFEMCMKVSNV